MLIRAMAQLIAHSCLFKYFLLYVREAIHGENPVKVGIVPTRGEQFQLKTGELERAEGVQIFNHIIS